MKTILEWLKPGARVKRYIFIQIASIALLIFCVVTLSTTSDLSRKMLIAYIVLITLSIFGVIFSFVLAQKNILYVSLKNISRKSKSIRVRKLLYQDPRLKKGPKVVVIGGGSGLPYILKGLKEFTSNITAVVNVSEDDATISAANQGMDYLTTGDIRKCIAALSTSESDLSKLLTYKNNENETSVGNSVVSALINLNGSFAKGVAKISEVFKMQGNIYPVTTDNIVLCAGLENGEVVVGKENIVERVSESRSRVKQIFLKEGSVKALPEVIEAIKSANVIVLGPGALYTSVAPNLLIEDVSKAIIKSRAKKIYISNIMNQPGQTDGYTLARYINEIERYIGKHVLDYAIVNNGEITQEMIKDFNQEGSTQIKIDLENIQNRAISVVKSDLVLTAPGKLIHDSDKIAEIIMSITKSKRIGNLNIVKLRKKHLRKEKTLKLKQLLKNKKSKKNNLNNSSKVSSNKNNISVAEINKVKARANKAVSHATTKKEMKAHAKSTATINKIKEVVNRKG